MNVPSRSAALLLLGAAASLSASSPFEGNWKLNLAKSRISGDTFTYAAAPSGLMQYDNGQTWAYEFGLDGKPYAAPDHTMVTWTQVGANQWLQEWRFGDKVINKTATSLSSDGKTLTNDSTDFRSDGTEGREKDVYTRVSGGPGLLGKWKNVKVQPSITVFLLSEPSPGRIRFEDPTWKTTWTGATDGTPSPLTGPDLPSGWTIAMTATGPRSMKQVNRFGDKVMYEGTLKVSKDGQTLSGIFWVPGKEDEKTMNVFEKQKPAPWRASAAVEQELLALERAWADAMVKVDLPKLEEILAAEYVFIDGEGVSPRASELKNLQTGEFKAESVDLGNLQVRVYGSTAVVTGLNTEKSTWHGKDHAVQEWFTDVFVKRDGRWQCVSSHGAPAPKPMI